jgi:hypothetical protein
MKRILAMTIGLAAMALSGLEFYQDNEGLARYEQTVKDFEGLFAQNNKMQRKLVPGRGRGRFRAS